MDNEIDTELHKIIARHDGLHGITHNIMGGKMLSEEHCANCRETAQSIKAALKRIVLEQKIQDYLDTCFPMSDHDDIRNGDRSYEGGFLNYSIILDRITQLKAELEKL